MKKLVLTLMVYLSSQSFTYAGNLFEDLANLATLGEYHNQIKQMRAKTKAQLAENRAELAKIKVNLKKQLVQVRVDAYQQLVDEAVANHEQLVMAKDGHGELVLNFEKLIIAQNRATKFWEFTEISAVKMSQILDVLSSYYQDAQGIQITGEYNQALNELVAFLNTDIENNPEIMIALQQIPSSLLHDLYMDIQKLDISVFEEMIAVSEQVVARLSSRLDSHKANFEKIGN